MKIQEKRIAAGMVFAQKMVAYVMMATLENTAVGYVSNKKMN